MSQGLEEEKVALTKAKDEYVMYYNHQCEPAPVFAPGDKVWLDGSTPLIDLYQNYLTVVD
jgi:hypothetical protein